MISPKEILFKRPSIPFQVMLLASIMILSTLGSRGFSSSLFPQGRRVNAIDEWTIIPGNSLKITAQSSTGANIQKLISFVLPDAAAGLHSPVDVFILNGPDNTTIGEGTLGNEISWTATATGSDPDNYIVYRNGTEHDNGFWAVISPGNIITTKVDGLTLGIFNFTIVIYDEAGNSDQDTVFITVIDTSPPQIVRLSKIQYEEGTPDHFIAWELTELHPYNFTIYKDGTVNSSGSWDGSDISINVTGLAVGKYNYNLTVFDESGNTNSDLVEVEVILPDPGNGGQDQALDPMILGFFVLLIGILLGGGIIVLRRAIWPAARQVPDAEKPDLAKEITDSLAPLLSRRIEEVEEKSDLAEELADTTGDVDWLFDE